MCGIAGIIGKEFEEPVLNRMVKRLWHRGPDHTGVYIDHEVGLAQSRLSIIDLSSAGNQPFTSIDHPHFTIVFNGEIYNYIELKGVLAARGYDFHTNSDTEVLLKLYIEFGKECVFKLRGMFAFVIWCSQTKEVFIARDRFGIKPLYYALQNNTFYFASEVRALLESNIEKSVNYQAIYDYLSLGAICNPETIFRDIQQFAAGSYAFLSPDRTDLQVYKYWDLLTETSVMKKEFAAMSYNDCAAILRNGLEEAVRCHLCADVEVGAFLSGGIDSSLITLLMSKYQQSPMNTFSIGFDGFEPYNEVGIAKVVAEKVGSSHHQKILTQQDFDLSLFRLLDSFDEPSMDGTNTFFVSLAAAEAGMRVVLSGLGGDELMAGYPHFRRLRRLDALFPKGIPLLKYDLLDKYTFIPSRIRHLIRDAASGSLGRYGRIRNLLQGRPAAIISSEFLAGLNLSSVERRYEEFVGLSADSVELTTIIEVHTYLRDTLLRDSDNMSMGHSLELRPVFLDHEIVKTMFSLPSHYKQIGSFNKQILVDSVKDLLPEQVYKRKKMGFEFPLGFWMMQHKDVLRSAFDGVWAKRIFSSSFLNQVQRKLSSNSAITNQIWAYFILLYYLEENAVKP
jgi:asparagine synthase (glutamine-hydrolysing)